MIKFHRDAPIGKVIKALAVLGFEVIRQGNHISMIKINPDGTQTPLTSPNHKEIKSSTLQLVLRQAGISRNQFLDIFNEI